MASDREARLDALLDRQDIYDCLVRMSRGTDRADKALFLTAFHADAVIAAGPFVGNPEELFDWSAELQAMVHSATYHTLLNHSCDIDGDTAHAETYYLYIANNRDQTNMFAGGRYLDKFERRDGEWKLAVRNNSIEWSSVVPALDNPLAAVPDILANGIAARGPEDISYVRPLENKRDHCVPKFG